MASDWRWNKTLLTGSSSEIGKGFLSESYNIFGENIKIGENVTVGGFNHFEANTEIDSNVVIGSFNHIGPKVKIKRNAKIGSHNKIGSKTILEERCSVGSHVAIRGNQTIGMNSIISDFAQISKGVNLGYGCYIDIRASLLGKYVFENEKSCHLSELVYIGANSIVMPGVSISKGVVIGQNSVVEKNCFLRFCYYSGNPLKFKRNIIPEISLTAYDLRRAI